MEVLLEVREGFRVDDEGAGRAGRDDGDEIGVVFDEFQDGGKALGDEDRTGVDVLAHQRAVGSPDGVARLLRKSLAGCDEGGGNRADDGAGVEVERVPARGREEVKVRVHRFGEGGLRISIDNETRGRNGQQVLE